jgi:hypothetical protein
MIAKGFFMTYANDALEFKINLSWKPKDSLSNNESWYEQLNKEKIY